MKKTASLICLITLLVQTPGNAQAEDLPALVDITAFKNVLDESEIHRRSRQVTLDQFLEMSREKGTIILDTRSKEAFDKKHIKGAVHLNFSDFTEGKLASVIPEKTTRILIYCNNNVSGDPRAFADKKISLALNIPTFVNLFGYGYKNIYELASLVDIKDPRWEFVGSAMGLDQSSSIQR